MTPFITPSCEICSNLCEKIKLTLSANSYVCIFCLQSQSSGTLVWLQEFLCNSFLYIMVRSLMRFLRSNLWIRGKNIYVIYLFKSEIFTLAVNNLMYTDFFLTAVYLKKLWMDLTAFFCRGGLWHEELCHRDKAWHTRLECFTNPRVLYPKTSTKEPIEKPFGKARTL